MRLFVDFIPIMLWGVFAVALVVIMLLASWVLRPHVPQNSEKTSTYECGEEPIGTSRISYPYNYFVFTLLFVVIEVLGALLYLLAVSSLRTSVAVVWQVLLFILIVMGSVGYAMRYLPQTTPDGRETVILYRRAKSLYTSSDDQESRR